MTDKGEAADVRGESGSEGEGHRQTVCQADDDITEYWAIVGVVFGMDVFSRAGSLRGKGNVARGCAVFPGDKSR